MDFLQKILKKKVGVQDVLNALENFSNDVKSLNEISSVALLFFGVNWKFNLEMYISTMDAEDRKKYLPMIRNVLTFDKALSLWMSAQQVLKGAKPLSADVIKNIGEYEEYLPKFGVEGVRLLDKLKSKLNIADDTVVLSKKEVVDKKDDEVDVSVEEVVPDDAEDDVVEEVSVVKEAEEQPVRILKRVSSKELEEGVFVKLPKTKEVALKDEKEDAEVEHIEVEESKSEPVDVSKEDVKSWDLENFVRVYSFVPQIREVMSAISLFKNANSLEEYPYYGFIIDVIDYLISQAEKILSTESEDVVLKYFKGGRSELESIISMFKQQKNEEVVILPASSDAEIDKKEYEIKED